MKKKKKIVKIFFFWQLFLLYWKKIVSWNGKKMACSKKKTFCFLLSSPYTFVVPLPVPSRKNNIEK